MGNTLRAVIPDVMVRGGGLWCPDLVRRGAGGGAVDRCG